MSVGRKIAEARAAPATEVQRLRVLLNRKEAARAAAVNALEAERTAHAETRRQLEACTASLRKALHVQRSLIARIALDNGCDHCTPLTCTNPCDMQWVRKLVGGDDD